MGTARYCGRSPHGERGLKRCRLRSYNNDRYIPLMSHKTKKFLNSFFGN